MAQEGKQILWGAFKDTFAAALRDYGAGVALLVLASALLIIGIVVLFTKHERLWQSRLRDKDREIARLAETIRRLEERILTRRLSSGLDEEGEPRPSRRRE